jgi:hypothetical protein
MFRFISAALIALTVSTAALPAFAGEHHGGKGGGKGGGHAGHGASMGHFGGGKGAAGAAIGIAAAAILLNALANQ